MQAIAAQPAVQDEAVESLLHLVAGPVQFIQEQHERLVPGDVLWRAEPAARLIAIADDSGHADKVFRRQLRTKQRFAFKADLPGELLDQARFANPRLTPDKHRPRDRYVQ